MKNDVTYIYPGSLYSSNDLKSNGYEVPYSSIPNYAIENALYPIATSSQYKETGCKSRFTVRRNKARRNIKRSK